ncbi:endoplasmic reticulum resident protein 27 [Manacus vitellinus]|uniref:endoplasmic reticulum resident protein 27 n=1 Tax=Manacus vitellinus TaxID=328815 RepID=UPI00115E3E3A|nr:endoplasmic reticulum resident protein 27 [Manacus vitellinus]
MSNAVDEDVPVAVPVKLSKAGTASTTEKPVLLNNIADAEAFVSGAEVAVIGFFQAGTEGALGARLLTAPAERGRGPGPGRVRDPRTRGPRRTAGAAPGRGARGGRQVSLSHRPGGGRRGRGVPGGAAPVTARPSPPGPSPLGPSPPGPSPPARHRPAVTPGRHRRPVTARPVTRPALTARARFTARPVTARPFTALPLPPQEPESAEASQFRLTAGRIPEVPFGLSTSPAVLSHYGVSANTVTLFRRADNDRRNLDMNNEDVDTEKMTRFVRLNELRLVTEYNPVTAVGVMQSSLQFNLLLITDKMSPKHPERMRKFRAAAELFKGKILFILLDSNLKSNEPVVSYFQLKKSQLPALAIFHTPDDEHDVMTVDEISIEHVKDFCNRFIQRMKKKEDESEKPLNEEL